MSIDRKDLKTHRSETPEQKDHLRNGSKVCVSIGVGVSKLNEVI